MTMTKTPKHTMPKQHIYDVNRKADMELLEDYDANFFLRDLLRTDPIIFCKQRPIFFMDEYWVVDENNIPIPCGDSLCFVKENFTNRKSIPYDRLDAILVPLNKRQKYLPIVNGDEDITHNFSGEFHDRGNNSKHITMSFTCLNQFYAFNQPEKRYETISKVGNGQIKVIDFTDDSKISLNDKEIKQHKKWLNNNLDNNRLRVNDLKNTCPLVCPKVGYSLVPIGSSYFWHRSATILLFDVVNNFTILLGQDEGTYFGVQLSDNPKTINAAYKSLMPKAIVNQSSIQRQGEWFALSVQEKDVPALKDCAAIAHSNSYAYMEQDNDYFALPKEDIDSAYHSITSDDIRVSKDGIVYALSPTLYHSKGEHGDLSLVGWNSFHKNTAVRAFSVEGVD